MEKKYSILDYFALRGDISFKEKQVNEVDIMMFACLGKPNLDGFVPDNGEACYFRDAYAQYRVLRESGNKKPGLLESQIFIEALDAAVESERYKDIKVSHFINKIVEADTEQLSAITVEGPDGVTYVTFRGTDDTLIGWKENCDLAILEEVPAQRDAVLYLEHIAKCYSGPIIVAGHSKGGNLAIYAASMASEEVQSRILAVYSYDGPGFRKDFFDHPGYKKIKDRIFTYVPYASIIGMIMSPAGKLRVIACEETGPSAHDVYLWNIYQNGFIHLNDISTKSKVFHLAINKTLNEMDMDKRAEFTDELFKGLFATGAFYLMDFSEQSLKKAMIVASQFTKSKEVRKFILSLTENAIKLATLEKLEEEIESQDLYTHND